MRREAWPDEKGEGFGKEVIMSVVWPSLGRPLRPGPDRRGLRTVGKPQASPSPYLSEPDSPPPFTLLRPPLQPTLRPNMPGHKLKTVLVTYPLEPPSLIDRLKGIFEVRPHPQLPRA